MLLSSVHKLTDSPEKDYFCVTFSLEESMLIPSYKEILKKDRFFIFFKYQCVEPCRGHGEK